MSKKTISRRSAAVPGRRGVRSVLVAGIVLAVAAAFGPIWFVRAGIAIMIVAAVIAVRFAWKQLSDERRENGLKSLDQLHAHGMQLSAERTRNREVLDVLRKQGEENDRKVVELQLTIGQLRTELTSLRATTRPFRPRRALTSTASSASPKTSLPAKPSCVSSRVSRSTPKSLPYPAMPTGMLCPVQRTSGPTATTRRWSTSSVSSSRPTTSSASRPERRFPARIRAPHRPGAGRVLVAYAPGAAYLSRSPMT